MPLQLPPPQSLLLRFLKRDARKLGTSAKRERGFLARPASPNRGGATGDEAAPDVVAMYAATRIIAVWITCLIRVSDGLKINLLVSVAPVVLMSFCFV